MTKNMYLQIDAFALTGRKAAQPHAQGTQGVALGYKPNALSGRANGLRSTFGRLLPKGRKKL